jgi:hypothetical protein
MIVMVFGIDFVARLSGIVGTLFLRINLNVWRALEISNACELLKPEFEGCAKWGIGVVRWDERQVL